MGAPTSEILAVTYLKHEKKERTKAIRNNHSNSGYSQDTNTVPYPTQYLL
jgi:hypothetical protein